VTNAANIKNNDARKKNLLLLLIMPINANAAAEKKYIVFN